MSKKIDFYTNVNIKLQDSANRSAILNATDRAVNKRDKVVAEIENFEELREIANKIKRAVVNNLQINLNKFIENAEKNDFIIHIAKDGDEAKEITHKILSKHNVKKLVKSKSMVSEEIELNDYLVSKGYQPYETDLGEYIIQIAGEKPSHITGPAIHKNRKEIAQLFNEKLGMEYTEDPEQITAFARKILREQFLTADAGVTGGNFLIIEDGSFILIENEANIRLTTTLPPLQISIIGIEKMIPKLTDLSTFLKLLPPSSTGQKITGYVNFIRKVNKGKEKHIILLDNNRKSILANKELNSALMCIKCGACANVCPVFQLVGGHPYDSPYSGSIGIPWTYFLYGEDKIGDLPYACTLCGACNEVCPAKINLTDMILEIRHNVADKSLSLEEKGLIKLWSFLFGNRIINKISFTIAGYIQYLFAENGKIKNLPLILRKWTGARDIYKLINRK